MLHSNILTLFWLSGNEKNQSLKRIPDMVKRRMLLFTLGGDNSRPTINCPVIA